MRNAIVILGPGGPWALAVALLVSACASPAATPQATGMPGVTLIPEATTPPTSAGPPPSDTPAPPTDVPQPTATVPCSNDSAFLADVTVPDGTAFQPGQPIDKIWTIQNVGTCHWGADYRLVFVSGEAMGAPTEMGLYPAASGAVATLRILMTAPAQPGEHVSRWQARAPDGTRFGAVVFAKIVVVAPEATPVP